jgi:hypothetical protein
LTSRTAETLNSRVNFRRAIAVAPLDRLYPVRPERTRFVGKVTRALWDFIRVHLC